MKRTTVFVEEHVESDLHAIARRQRRPVAALVREALARYVAAEQSHAAVAPGFLAVGRSGHRDTAERHEELLWTDLATRRPVPGQGASSHGSGRDRREPSPPSSGASGRRHRRGR